MDEYKRNKLIVNVVFNVLVIFTLAFMLVSPLFGTWYKENIKTVSNVSALLIILTMITTFYFSKYKKAEKYVSSIENEINDSGYFIPNYSVENIIDVSTKLYNNFGKDNFSLNSNVAVNGREFEFKGTKGKDSAYLSTVKKLELDEYCEIIDAVNADASYSNVRSKQTVACVIAARQVDDDVVALSKMVTVISKTVVYPVIYDIEKNMVYFLSTDKNRTSFIVKNILGYSDLIIPDNAKCQEKLEFQTELQRKMYTFNINDFKKGTFNPRH